MVSRFVRTRTFLILALLFAILALAGTAVFAAGGRINQIQVALIGENVEMEVAPPIVVSNASGGITIDWEPGARNPVFPGQQIAQGAMTLKNVSPISYAINFEVTPVVVDGQDWPAFLVNTSWQEKVPGSRLVLGPSEEVRVEVTVQVAYYSQPASFSGLTLNIWVSPPQAETCCPGKG